ncbi:hypothetical protein C1I63_10395 [Rathayibacter caricis DSM 15933]|uniref:ECF transporter S component n=1 Tax=Rathayibacter caricis DSM 15933 TaxID=1328867 RepID=A0A2T4UUM2_9MICO|nr:hypothetical protein [Rathayibacter caricis]PTL73217.1 hypothetical protein C1I63_10395 [Rathayibacter caricis DSM 15933]
MVVAASVFAVVQVILTLVIQPALTALAVVVPVAYAAVASVTVLPQLIAGRFVRARGAIILTAVFAGFFSIPLTPLGVLVVPAFALPAVAVEGVLWLGRYRWNSRLLWSLACVSGGLVASIISLVVISASLFSTAFVLSIVLARVCSAIVLSFAATAAEGMLVRVGARA